jgi:hypothetical protein
VKDVPIAIGLPFLQCIPAYFLTHTHHCSTVSTKFEESQGSATAFPASLWNTNSNEKHKLGSMTGAWH